MQSNLDILTFLSATKLSLLESMVASLIQAEHRQCFNSLLSSLQGISICH